MHAQEKTPNEFMSESSSQHSFSRYEEPHYAKMAKESEGIQPTQTTYKPYSYLQKSSSTLS